MITNKLKIILLMSYICIASMSAAIITPALPYIVQTYSLKNGSVEWIISIFLFGYVIGQLIYGPVANCYGRLFALRMGLIINLIGIVVCLLAVFIQDYVLLLIGRLITALGAASGLSCTFMLIHELLFPEDAKQALSFAIVPFTIGIGLAVTLGGLTAQYLHWYDCFWLLLIHGIVMLLCTWQFQETLTHAVPFHPKKMLTDYLRILINKQFIVFSLMVGFASSFAYGYSAIAPIYAHTHLHLSASQYGYWNLINMIGMLGSGFLSAFLIKNYGEKQVLLLGLGLIIPALLSLVLLSWIHGIHSFWFFITTMLLYLFTGLIFPAASYFASTATSDKASTSSMMSFINMGSAMVSVIIIGYLPFSSIVSFTITMIVFFILILISYLLAGVKTRAEKKFLTPLIKKQETLIT